MSFDRNAYEMLSKLSSFSSHILNNTWWVHNHIATWEKLFVPSVSVFRMASSEESNKRPNRLLDEKSPYLLQHAYNPVDW